MQLLAKAFRLNDKMKQVDLNVKNTKVGPDSAKEIILAFKNNKVTSSAIFNFTGIHVWNQK